MSVQALAPNPDLQLRAAQAASASGEAAKIGKAGRDFESILLGSWLQGAESSFGSVPGGDEDEDAGGEQLKNIGVQQLATALAGSGGIGLGKLIAEQLRSTVKTPASTPQAP